MKLIILLVFITSGHSEVTYETYPTKEVCEAAKESYSIKLPETIKLHMWCE